MVAATEGPTDLAILRRVCQQAGVEIHRGYGERGKQFLDARLSSWNAAARHAPWLVLRDLDTDAGRAPELATTLLPAPSRGMLLFIAVRAVESWLLADRGAFSRFFQVSRERLPPNPEVLVDPKAEIVRLARRSRSRVVRQDMVPPVIGGAAVGPGYTARVIEYVQTSWDPLAAAAGSASLRRCFRKLGTIGSD